VPAARTAFPFIDTEIKRYYPLGDHPGCGMNKRFVHARVCAEHAGNTELRIKVREREGAV
jgi:hypothetical protein